MSAHAPSTFEHDLLNLKPFAERLEKWLMVEHDYVEGSLVVALEAGFGSGKTTLIEMWRNDLLARRDNGEFCPMPVVLNAWESDYCGEPLVAILAGLQEALEHWHGKDKPDNVSKFKEAAKDVAYFGLALANGFAASATGLNAMEAGEKANARKAARKAEIPDFITHYRQRKEALHRLQTEMSEAFGGAAPKVIVFVDELDRCRPDYAVSYLETIKHVFNLKGMVFVLAIDYPHLMNSTKSLFGQDLNFPEYFRKFCHRQFQLPELKAESYSRLSEDYVKKYILLEARRSGLPADAGTPIRCAEIARCFNLNPRQIQEAFRIVGHATSTQATDRKVLWAYLHACILMCFLKVADPPLFHKFLAGNAAHRDLALRLIDGLGINEAQWYIELFLVGSVHNNSPKDFVSRTLSDLGYEVTANYDAQVFRDFASGWGHGLQHHSPSDNRVSQLCRHIESAKTF